MRRLRSLIATAALVALVALVMTVVPRSEDRASAQADPQELRYCYGVADQLPGGRGDDPDHLTRVNTNPGPGEPISEVIGSGAIVDESGKALTGIETIGFVAPAPDSGSTRVRLFAYNDAELGEIIIDETPGANQVFKPLAKQVLKDKNTTGEGVDSMSYSVQENVIYAVMRIEDTVNRPPEALPDVLYKLSLEGDLLAGPIEIALPDLSTSDFFVDENGTKLPYGDVDDIAIDPFNSDNFYAILNRDGTGGGLARLNRTNGEVNGTWEEIAKFIDRDTNQLVNDMEGLAYSATGVLYGSTGDNGPVEEDKNKLYRIDSTNAASVEVGAFPADQYEDYEALACLTATVSIDVEKFTQDYDLDGDLEDQGPGPTLKVGDEVKWTYIVSNTSSDLIELERVKLVDDKVGLLLDAAAGTNNCEQQDILTNTSIFSAGKFLPGQSFTCTFTGTVPGVDVPLGDTDADQYANMSQVEGFWTDPDGKVQAAKDEDPSFYNRATAAVIEIVKTALPGAGQNCPAYADGVQGLGNPVELTAGGTATYCLTVKNSGNAPAQNVKIVDDKGTASDTTDDQTFDIGALAAGEEKTVTYEGTSAVPTRIENVAKVTGEDSAGTALPEDSDPAVVQYSGTPQISIVKKVVVGPNGDCTKAVDSLADQPKGTTFTYCIVATNDGDVPLTAVEIDDDYATPTDLSDDKNFPVGNLAPGASTSVLTYDRTVDGVVRLDNTAVVAGTDPTGNTLTARDSASVSTIGEPGLNITKGIVLGPNGNCADAVKTLLVNDGATVTFCVTVTNTGDATATNVVLTDDAGTPNDPADDAEFTIDSIAPGASEVWSYDRVITEEIVNTACIKGTDKCDTANPKLPPILAIDKLVVVGADSSCADAQQQVEALPGETVKYCVVVKNVGKGDAIDVVVSDDNATIEDKSDDQSFSLGTLKPGESAEVPPYTRVVTGVGPQVITNVATATGKDIAGNEITPVDDDAVVFVPGDVALKLTKLNVLGPNGNCDAAEESLETIVGATVTYCVTIENTGTASAFDVKIFDDMNTPDDPSDDKTIEIGELPAGEKRTVTYDYVVPAGVDPAAGLKNTATATGVDKDGNKIPVNPDTTVVTVPEPEIGEILLTKTILSGHDRDCADATEGLNELFIDKVGADVTWCITIFSDSQEESLGVFEMTDEVLGITPDNQPDEISNLVLGPGESYTLAVNDTIEEEGQVNTVVVTGAPVDANNQPLINPATGQIYERFREVNTAANGEAEIMLAKTVLYGADRDCSEAVNPINDLAVGNVGDALTWCFTATNVGAENLQVTEIVDPILDLTLPVAEADQFLAPAASVTLSADGAITEEMVENIASVEGMIVDPDGNPMVNPETGEPYGPVTDEDPAKEGPAILRVEKTVLAGADRDCSAATEGVDEFVVGESGDPITWCITIVNDGTVSITDLTFGDDLLSIAVGPLADYLASAADLVLAPDDSVTFPVAGTQRSAIGSDAEKNTAVVTGVPVYDDGSPIPDAPTITDQNDAANDQIDVELLKWMVAGHDVDCSTLPTDDKVITGSPGDPISYCFRVTNTGNADLTVKEIVDTTLDLTLAIPAEDQVLASGESYNTSYESTITMGMTENTACVEGTATDPNGNTATTSDCDDAPPPAAQLTDLSIVKTAAQTSVKLGQVVDYTLTITNNGPGEAQNVRVEDLLPSQLVIVNGSVIGEGWDCSASVAKVDCSRPSMLANTSSSIRFSAVVDSNPVSGNTVTNTSTVSTTTTESDYTNNKDSYTVTIITPIPPKPTPIPPKPTPIPPKPKPIKPPPPKLAITGADSGQLASVGFAAIAAGLGLAVMTRRRREEQ